MICLTFDTDWMTQATLSEFLERIPIPGRGTFFCHEPFPRLEDTVHEVGPHPFIDRLSEWSDATKAITGKLRTPPRGLRAHSCVFSHMIGVGMFDQGYRYVSQAQHLFQDGLEPYRHPWGIWEVPIYYMDNMDFCTPRNWPGLGHVPFHHDVIATAVRSDALFVFGMHPIHIALNTRTSEDYVAVKERIVSGGESPFALRFPGRGAGVFFSDLCEAMENASLRSHTCSEALDRLGCN